MKYSNDVRAKMEKLVQVEALLKKEQISNDKYNKANDIVKAALEKIKKP